MSKGATNKKLEAKIEAKLKEITKRSENRKCMDCREKGPRYVVLNFNIFVCSSCSGIHREFQHRAVGVSMSKFTMEQVKALDEGGNKVAKKLWMSRWDANEFPEPDTHDIPKIREFIRKNTSKSNGTRRRRAKSRKAKTKAVTTGEIPKAATSKTWIRRRIQRKDDAHCGKQKKSIERSASTK